MGKITGFMEFERQTSKSSKPLERIQHFNAFHTPLSKQAQQEQAARCMDCGVPFCQNGTMIKGMVSGCPLQNLVPEFNHLIYKDRYELAFARLSATNRFAEFTSRACPALCEAACTCSATGGDSVSVKENEFAIIEEAYAKGYMYANPPKNRSGKRVAVIGSGPSGLASAEWLNKRGHKVCVYERSDRLGGLLMYGIPNMKIEKWSIDRRIDIMKEEGIEFVTSCNVGVDICAQQLQEEYDAIVLCCGASKPRDIQVEGRDAKGIYFAVDYLKSITKSLLDSDFEDQKAIDAKGKKVLVIGGGDTGNDCVGSAIRQGCTQVIQLEMMPQLPLTRSASNAWPQWPFVLKTDYGQQEAIAKFGQDPRMYQSTVKNFIKDAHGNVNRVCIEKLEPKVENGRTQMEATGESFEVEADLVLIAAGFVGSESYVSDAFQTTLTPRGNVQEQNFKTNTDKVFVAGDMRRGQSLIVWALREGRDVAREVDTYLMGYSNL